MAIKIFQNKPFVFTIGFLVVAGLVVGTMRAYAAWENPSAPPPNGNVAAPINVSNVHQLKEGGFSIAGTVDGSNLFTVSVEDIYLSESKFHFNTATGKALLRNDLEVLGTLTAANVSLTNLSLDQLTVNDTLTVDTDLLVVDGVSDKVNVGAQSVIGTGLLQAYNDVNDGNPALFAQKLSGADASAIVARNSDNDKGALFAWNDLGHSVWGYASADKSSGVFGETMRGTSNFGTPEDYNAGVRGEAALNNSHGNQAAAGVLGIGRDLAGMTNNVSSSFGVFGLAADINGVVGTGTHRTYGVYGAAAGTLDGNANSRTYGVYGNGIDGGSNTIWAGYFNGNVQVTKDLFVTEDATVSGTISASTVDIDNDSSGYALDINKTGSDVEAAAKITGASGSIYLGGTEADLTKERYAAKLEAPLLITSQMGPGLQHKQIVFDPVPDPTAGHTYFNYNYGERCLELWMPDDAFDPKIVSPTGGRLYQEWGDQCSGPCESPGVCYETGGFFSSCPAGWEITDGKCEQFGGFENGVSCCRQSL